MTTVERITLAVLVQCTLSLLSGAAWDALLHRRVVWAGIFVVIFTALCVTALPSYRAASTKDT